MRPSTLLIAAAGFAAVSATPLRTLIVHREPEPAVLDARRPADWKREASPADWKREASPADWKREASPADWKREANPADWKREASPADWKREPLLPLAN